MKKKKKEIKQFGGYLVRNLSTLFLGLFIYLIGVIADDNSFLILGVFLMLCWHIDQRIMNVNVNMGELARHLFNFIRDDKKKTRKRLQLTDLEARINEIKRQKRASYYAGPQMPKANRRLEQLNKELEAFRKVK